jgi:hypothetical protein
LPIQRIAAHLAVHGAVDVAATELAADQRVEPVRILDASIAGQAFHEARTKALAGALVALVVDAAFASCAGIKRVNDHPLRY